MKEKPTKSTAEERSIHQCDSLRSAMMAADQLESAFSIGQKQTTVIDFKRKESTTMDMYQLRVVNGFIFGLIKEMTKDGFGEVAKAVIKKHENKRTEDTVNKQIDSLNKIAKEYGIYPDGEPRIG